MGQRAARLGDSLSMLFSRETMGLAFLRAWSTTFFSEALMFGGSNTDVSGWGTTVHQISLYMLVATFFAVGFLCKMDFPGVRRRPYGVVSLAAILLGSALVLAAVFMMEEPQLMLVVGAVLTGIGSAMMTVAWGYVYSKMDLRPLFVASVGSTFLAALIVLAFHSCTALTFVVLAILAPVASALCLAQSLSSDNGLEARMAEEARCEDRVGFASMLIGTFLLSAVIGALGACSRVVGGVADDSSLFVRMVLLALVIVVMLLFNVSRAGTLLFAAGLALAVILLALPFAQSGQGVALNCELGMCIGRAVIWAYLACMFVHFKLPPLIHFGLGLGCHFLGINIGGELFSKVFLGMPVSNSPAGMFVFSLSCMFVLILPYLISVHVANRNAKWKERSDGEELDARQEKIDRIAVEYGLTEREKEIFGLISQGLSSKAVEEKLSISASTVSTHVSSVYRKMGIHSKVQAARLVAEWE